MEENSRCKECRYRVRGKNHEQGDHHKKGRVARVKAKEEGK